MALAAKAGGLLCEDGGGNSSATPEEDCIETIQTRPSSGCSRERAQGVLAGFKTPHLWVLAFGWLLAACAGMVNTVSFLAYGYFATHVTGSSSNVALAAAGPAGHNPQHEAMWLIGSFASGSFLCGLLIDRNFPLLPGGKCAYGLALIGNAVLLCMSALGAPPAEGGSHIRSACAAAAACGLQNAMCTSHFGPSLRTTHVTGTVTDIGSALGRLTMVATRGLWRRIRCEQQPSLVLAAEMRVDLQRLLVLVPIWFSFCIGGYVGGCLGQDASWGRRALLLPACLSAVLGLLYAALRQHVKLCVLGRSPLAEPPEGIELLKSAS